MKIILALLFSCAVSFPETKTEADLKRQLEAAKAALVAEEAHVKALQAGQKKLTDAVAVQAETSKKNSDKIEAATDKLIESEATGKKLVETVQSQGAASQSATKELAHEVKTQSAAVTSAITSQTKQQEQALRAAREVARKLEQSNKELAETKRQDAARLDETNKQLEKLLQQREVAAALDKRGSEHDRYAFWSVAAPIFGTIILGILGLIQLRKSSQTHTMVNGQRDAMLARIKELEAQAALHPQSLDAPKGLHL